MPAAPLISVVMPVWNGERYLSQAIDSILNQTFRDFEFIILDDGSTDASPRILADYQARDPRVRVIRLNHEGIVVALNRGIAEARSEWIARMDCDDIAYPERLESQFAELQKSGASLCHTQVRLIGDPRWLTPAGRFVRSQALLKLRFCFQCVIVHPTVMFRRSRFHALGGYLPEERHAEDYSLWSRFLQSDRIIGLSEPLLDFRVHGDSISKLKADVQELLSRTIGIRNCEVFLGLNHADATRAYDALYQDALGKAALRDWMWFLCRCAPRLRSQSLEMWAWLASRTLRNLLARMHP